MFVGRTAPRVVRGEIYWESSVFLDGRRVLFIPELPSLQFARLAIHEWAARLGKLPELRWESELCRVREEVVL